MIQKKESTVFLSLAKTLNFTNTAQELYMSQSNVSRIISGLEAKLGAPLFQRSTHFVSLTPFGEAYSRFLAETTEKYEELLKTAGKESSETALAFRIAYNDSLFIEAAPLLAVRQLQAEESGKRILLNALPPQDVLSSLNDGSCDLAILNGWNFPPLGHDFAMEEVYQVPISILVCTNRAESVKNPTWASFAKDPLIVGAFKGEAPEQYSRRALKMANRLNLESSSIIWAPNLRSAYTQAELGRGIMVSFALGRRPFGRNLKSFPLGHTESVAVFWRKNRENPLVHRFASILRGAYETQRRVQEANMQKERGDL